jgi:hypothetical protein
MGDLLMLYTDHTCTYTTNTEKLLDKILSTNVESVLIKENISKTAKQIMEHFREGTVQISNTGDIINCIKFTEQRKSDFSEVHDVDYRLATDIHEIIGYAAIYRIFSKNGINPSIFYKDFLELIYPWNYTDKTSVELLTDFTKTWNIIFSKHDELLEMAAINALSAKLQEEVGHTKRERASELEELKLYYHSQTFNRYNFIKRYSRIIDDLKKMYEELGEYQKIFVKTSFTTQPLQDRYNLVGDTDEADILGEFGPYKISNPDNITDIEFMEMKLTDLESRRKRNKIFRDGEEEEEEEEEEVEEDEENVDPWYKHILDFESEYKSNFSIFIELPAIIKFVSYLNSDLLSLNKNVVISMGAKHFEPFESLLVPLVPVPNRKFSIKANQGLFSSDKLIKGGESFRKKKKSSRKKKESSRKKKKSSRKKKKSSRKKKKK